MPLQYTAIRSFRPRRIRPDRCDPDNTESDRSSGEYHDEQGKSSAGNAAFFRSSPADPQTGPKSGEYGTEYSKTEAPPNDLIVLTRFHPYWNKPRLFRKPDADGLYFPQLTPESAGQPAAHSILPHFRIAGSAVRLAELDQRIRADAPECVASLCYPPVHGVLAGNHVAPPIPSDSAGSLFPDVNRSMKSRFSPSRAQRSSELCRERSGTLSLRGAGIQHARIGRLPEILPLKTFAILRPFPNMRDSKPDRITKSERLPPTCAGVSLDIRQLPQTPGART